MPSHDTTGLGVTWGMTSGPELAKECRVTGGLNMSAMGLVSVPALELSGRRWNGKMMSAFGGEVRGEAGGRLCRSTTRRVAGGPAIALPGEEAGIPAKAAPAIRSCPKLALSISKRSK